MDIVFLTTSLDRGGAETQLVRTAIWLKRRGWDVAILTMFPSTEFREDLRDSGIPYFECGERRSRIPLRTAFRVIRQLRQLRPAILLTVNYPADALGRFCGRLAGVPTILSSVLTAFIKNRFRKLFYRFTEPLVELTISNSKAAVEFMTSRRILSLEKTAVIPNGMITSNLASTVSREACRAMLDVPADRFVWLAVGNVRPAKDYPNLLAAAAICAKASVPFKLLIVGGGEDLEAMRTQVPAHGLQDHVQFLGPRTDVPQLLQAADAFVLSSAWEGLPNAVMEAMTAGLPVVATHVGSVREVVEEGHCGRIVPPKNAKALAEGMQAIMGLDAASRVKLGMSGRDHILRHFDIEHVMDQWEDVLRRVRGKKGRPSLQPSTPTSEKPSQRQEA